MQTKLITTGPRENSSLHNKTVADRKATLPKDDCYSVKKIRLTNFNTFGHIPNIVQHREEISHPTSIHSITKHALAQASGPI
jgi:hypothetical protein